MKKYALGIAAMLVAAIIIATGFMVSVKLSQRQATLADVSTAAKAVVNIQAVALNDGYFSWTKLQNLVKSNNISEADVLINDIKALYPLVKDVAIVSENPPVGYDISGTGATLRMRFSIKDDMGQNPLPGWVGVANVDFQGLLDILSGENRLVVDPIEGSVIAYGILARFSSPLLDAYDYIVLLLVSLAGAFPFIFLFWKRSIYFYESKGIESILFLFEQTEKVSAGHSRNVARLALFLATKLGTKGKPLRDLYTAALLHDIGKISIPSEVLFKAGALTAEEKEIIKAHPVISAKILKNFRELERLSPIVLHHHERMDGSGYPDRLVGYAIPYESRIIAVVDVFEALIGDRPYRDPISSKEAFAALKRMPLDQSIVAVLMRNFDDFSSFRTPNWVV